MDTKARRLVDLRGARDVAAQLATKAEKAYRAFEADFWAELEDEHGGVTSLDLDLGTGYGKVKLTRRETVYADIVDPEALAQSARDTGRDQELIKQADEATRKSDFRNAPLNELVRETLEHGGELLDGLSFRHDRGITITRK